MNSKFKIQNSTFPRYDRYKDSGVEWLGEIPEHWEPFRAKHVFRNVSEKGFPDEPLLSATQDRGVVPRDQLEQRVVMPVGQLQTFKLVREDNFVISLSSFQGVIEHCAYQGLVSPAYTVLRLQRDVNPRFLRHLLRASNFISELNISVTGIRQGKNIDYGDFAESILPIPPKPEQDRIVTFLDRKTAEIDALIAKKQRQIELLDEQKAILINRAVTRGLNPNAKLKPSGIEWIGEIPEGWEIKPLRWFCRIRSGDFVDGAHSSTEQTETNGIPIFGGNGLMGYTHQFNSPPNTMVLGRVGALCGNVHVTTAPTWVTDNALILSVKSPFLLRYTELALRCLDLNRLAAKNAQPLITGGVIKAQYLPLPPPE
ncbi:MAG: restriction endonuclease subunit S, partial [Akkermansiaceae bacterium]